MWDLKQKQNNLPSLIQKFHAQCKTNTVKLAYVQAKSSTGSDQSTVDI